MSAINFTGLASGLDTDAIIKGLMEVERQPLTRLESDKEYFQKRMDAFKEFDGKLTALNSAVDALDLNSDIRQSKATISSAEYVSAKVTSATPGSYEISVGQLAQVQKSVSQTAYASQTEAVFGTGELTLTAGAGVVSEGAGGTAHSISITEDNNSLMGIMDAINAGSDTHGVSAAIVDNGSDEGGRYYLMLTGADAATEFELSSALAGGEQTLALDAPTQTAQHAVAYVDGIEVTSQTNTIENALNGVTLNLEKVSPDDGAGGLETTTLKVETDTDAVVEKMANFANAYNDVVSFVTGQSKVGDSQGGVLLGDSGLNNAKRHLQNLLTNRVEGNDSYSALSQLGLSTNRDGKLDFDASAMTAAIADDFTEVTRLIAGDDAVDGIFKDYKSYLSSLTNSRTGLYAGREVSMERTIDRIDDDITAMEARLERREQMLLEKFSALEQLVSTMNSQSDYLTQQMDNMPSFGGKD